MPPVRHALAARLRATLAPLLLPTAFVLLLGLAVCNLLLPSPAAVPVPTPVSAPIAPHPESAPRGAQLHWLNLGGLALALLCLAVAGSLGTLRLRRTDRWVTICAWTRRIEWRGRWLTFEDFLEQRFDVRCTHGICADEAAKLCRSAGATFTPNSPRPSPAAEFARLRPPPPSQSTPTPRPGP
jgi:hypothetical protein